MKRVLVLCCAFANALVPPRRSPLLHKVRGAKSTLRMEGAHVSFRYCTGCKWMLRSAYYAQELLSTFDGGEIAGVSLLPQFDRPGGDFVVEVDGAVVWNRRTDGGFPETKVLKQRVRDAIDPDLSLGHSDGAAADPAPDSVGDWASDWDAETNLESDAAAAAATVDPADAARFAALGRRAAADVLAAVAERAAARKGDT